MNGQKISNLLTSLFLIGGLGLVVYFMLVNWEVYNKELVGGGTTITGGVVAFVVTFLVLILVTLVITFLNWTLNREKKSAIIGISDQKSVEIISAKKETVSDDSELIAVLTAAIHACNKPVAPYDTFKVFKVREMITSSQSWRIFSKDDLSGVGG